MIVVLILFFCFQVVTARKSPFVLSENSEFFKNKEILDEVEEEIVERDYTERFFIKGIVKTSFSQKVFIYDVLTERNFYLAEGEGQSNLYVESIHDEFVVLSYLGIQFELFLPIQRSHFSEKEKDA